MLQKSLLLFGLSISTVTLYSCKNNASNLKQEKSNGSKEYINVKMHTKVGNSDELLSEATAIKNFSFNVTVICKNAYGEGNHSKENYDINELNSKIPVITSKDCTLEFEHFSYGLGTTDTKYEPFSNANSKLKLEFISANNLIAQSPVAGHYVNNNSSLNKYINGFMNNDNYGLTLYVSETSINSTSVKEIDKLESFITKSLQLYVNYLTVPAEFPLKTLKTTYSLLTNKITEHYSISNPTTTSWPSNCKIIAKRHIANFDYASIHSAYLNENAILCTTVTLGTTNNWGNLSSEDQLIIISNPGPETISLSAYRVITVPKLN
jgi:hypothetical protein